MFLTSDISKKTAFFWALQKMHKYSILVNAGRKKQHFPLKQALLPTCS